MALTFQQYHKFIYKGNSIKEAKSSYSKYNVDREDIFFISLLIFWKAKTNGLSLQKKLTFVCVSVFCFFPIYSREVILQQLETKLTSGVDNDTFILMAASMYYHEQVSVKYSDHSQCVAESS